MPAEIDFSMGTRGRFAKPGMTLKLPVYLYPEVEAYFTVRASTRGVDADRLVNEQPKNDIEQSGRI